MEPESESPESEFLEERIRQAEKLEAVGQLAGGLAHDFNNLLGVILGYCDMLQEQAALPPASRQMVAHIHRAGTSARNLTQRLLAFNRRQVVQPVALDLNTAVRQIQTIFHGVIGPDIELRAVLARDLGAIKADPAQVEQVLMNLVINARDAMPAGGKIAVQTANVEIGTAQRTPNIPAGHYVQLSVGDTGTGIDAEMQAHLFEPFFSTKAAGQGTGLGLSTVFAIVQQCGGAVDFTTKPGKGTVFEVYFPRCAETLLPLRGGGETILLVEDATPLRQLTRQMLEGSGYTVVDTGDPAEALRLARECPGPVALMITDLSMPGFSGPVLAEKLSLVRPETKVLYMSGYHDDSIFERGVRGLDYEFLQKPFTREDLLNKVRALLDAPQSALRRPVRAVAGGASLPLPLSFG